MICHIFFSDMMICSIYTRDGAFMKIIKTWFANTDCEFLYCKLFTALEASMALTGGTGSSRYIHWFFFASTKINLLFVIEPACHTSIYTKALCCWPNHTEFLLNGCWTADNIVVWEFSPHVANIKLSIEKIFQSQQKLGWKFFREWIRFHL